MKTPSPLWPDRRERAPVLNIARKIAVPLVMKETCLLVAILAVLLTGDAPPPQAESNRTADSSRPAWDPPRIRAAAANMTAWASQVERDSASSQTAGNLWIEVNRLKRAGQNVGQVEWYVSDLEATLRRNPRDTAAKQRVLNDLQYEMERLKRRQRW